MEQRKSTARVGNCVQTGVAGVYREMPRTLEMHWVGDGDQASPVRISSLLLFLYLRDRQFITGPNWEQPGGTDAEGTGRRASVPSATAPIPQCLRCLPTRRFLLICVFNTSNSPFRFCMSVSEVSFHPVSLIILVFGTHLPAT